MTKLEELKAVLYAAHAAAYDAVADYDAADAAYAAAYEAYKKELDKQSNEN